MHHKLSGNTRTSKVGTTDTNAGVTVFVNVIPTVGSLCVFWNLRFISDVVHRQTFQLTQTTLQDFTVQLTKNITLLRVADVVEQLGNHHFSSQSRGLQNSIQIKLSLLAVTFGFWSSRLGPWNFVTEQCFVHFHSSSHQSWVDGQLEFITFLGS